MQTPWLNKLAEFAALAIATPLLVVARLAAGTLDTCFGPLEFTDDSDNASPGDMGVSQCTDPLTHLHHVEVAPVSAHFWPSISKFHRSQKD